MGDRMTIEVTERVADVRFNRADKMNALDMEQFGAIAQAIDELAARTDIRAVVLSGEGRAFCAGLDVANVGGLAQSITTGDDLTGPHHADGSNLFQYVAWGWRRLPVPVIAAVHGVAFGGGFQIMLGADMRYAAPDTRFSVMEIKWGLVPDMAGPQLMRHLARDDVIRELVYTGRIFAAEEAQAVGFVTALHGDPREAALLTAAEIASKSPDAIRAAKRLLNDAPLTSVTEEFAAEIGEQSRLIGSANQLEAVASQMQKRPADFKDPG